MGQKKRNIPKLRDNLRNLMLKNNISIRGLAKKKWCRTQYYSEHYCM